MRTTRFSFRTFMTEVACVLTMMLFMLHTTYAATVAFSVEVPSTTVVVGDTVEIKVSINAADQALSSYSYNITYDSTLLKAVSGGTVESEGTVSYSQANVKPGDAMTATFTFTAIASGTASIETSAVEVISDTEESIDMTPSYNSVTISDKSAPLHRPGLHGPGNLVGGSQFQRCSIGDAALPRLIAGAGQPLLHGFLIEYSAAKQFGQFQLAHGGPSVQDDKISSLSYHKFM